MTASRELITLLQRGGTYGHWWCQPGKRSDWWPVSKPSPVPRARLNVYFGVHPCEVIPETNRKGEPTPPEYVRSQIAHIQAINCFFAEYDSKDYAGDMAACLAHVRSLEPAPSAIVCSGGGYHAYWIFTDPWCLDTPAARQQAAELQAAWVVLMGGDKGAKDLARVLRVPGTKNYKYTPPESVQVIHFDRACLYDRAELIALAEPFVSAGPVSSVTNGIHPNYAKAALADETAKALLAPDGTKHAQLYKSAAALGELVGAHALDRQTVRGMLLGAIEGRAVDIQGAIDTIEDGIDKGASNPRRPKPPAVTGQIVPRNEAPDARPAEMIPYTGDDLMAMDLPEPRQFVNQVIREGLSFFIGQPGVGKTPALIQLTIALATGGLWLGAFRVPKVRVAYIGPEYDQRDVRKIIRESTGGLATLKNQLIYTIENFTPPRSDDEAFTILDDLVTKQRCEAIVIDLFTGYLPPEKFKPNAYRGDYREFLAYHRLALGHHILLTGAWHGTKRDANPATMYNGGQGFWGAAGGGRMVMYRDEEDQVKFYTQMRGNREMTYNLQESHIAGCRIWATLEGTTADPHFGSDVHRAIYRTVKEQAPSHGLTPRVIASLVQPELDHTVKEPYIRKCIGVLARRGLLKALGDSYVISTKRSEGSEGSQFSEGSEGSEGSETDISVSDPFVSQKGSEDRSATYGITEPQTLDFSESFESLKGSDRDRSVNGIGTPQNGPDFLTDPSDPLLLPIPDIFAGVPAHRQTVLRLYLRSNKDSDHDRAREICDQFEISYNDALAEVNKVKE